MSIDNIEKSFHSFFLRNNIPTDAKFLIAVSGGVDSMTCLALALKLNLKIAVAHVNFQLRAQEGDAETQLVTQFCKKNKIPIYVLKKDTKKYATTNKLSIQQAARAIRYDFFKKLTLENAINYVITGHHKQDNIETFFINSIRGSGSSGLGAIPNEREQFIRPLLDTSKNTIYDYAAKNGIPFSEDSSNLSSKYDRNFLRNEIIPQLENRFPNFNKGVNNTIATIKKDYELLQQLVNEKTAPFIKEFDACIYVAENKLGSEIWYQHLKHYGFNYAQINSLVNLKDHTGKKFIAKDYILYVDRAQWIITSKKNSHEAHHVFSADFQTTAPITISGALIEPPESLKVASTVALLDFDLLSFPLIIRKWVPGDYFFPIGLNKKKKLSDFFIDNKFSPIEKENTWVLENNKEIIWVIGARISDNYKINSNTKKCLKLSLC